MTNKFLPCKFSCLTHTWDVLIIQLSRVGVTAAAVCKTSSNKNRVEVLCRHDKSQRTENTQLFYFESDSCDSNKSMLHNSF